MSGATSPVEAERLVALRAHEILDTGPDPYLDHVVRAAARRLHMPIAQINLVDADRQWTKASTGLPSAYQIPREIAFCAHTILTPGTLTVIPDARLDPRVADNPLVTGRPGLRFYAGAPITDSAGRALGAICLIDTRPRDFPPADAEILRDLAADVSARLELYLSNAGLRESEAHYRAAAELNPHGPWTASAGASPRPPAARPCSARRCGSGGCRRCTPRMRPPRRPPGRIACAAARCSTSSTGCGWNRCRPLVPGPGHAEARPGRGHHALVRHGRGHP